jgi:hypothetical protein
MESLEVFQCFKDVTENVLYYDYTYCIGNLVILVSSGINAIILFVMLIWHLRDKNAKSHLKTLIYVLMLAVQTVVFLDFLIHTETGWTDVLVLITYNTLAFTFLAICYYFVEGATQLLDDSGSIIRFMNIFTVLAIIV